MQRRELIRKVKKDPHKIYRNAVRARIAAVKTLGKIADPRAIKILVGLLHEEDKEFSKVLAKVLVRTYLSPLLRLS